MSCSRQDIVCAEDKQTNALFSVGRRKDRERIPTGCQSREEKASEERAGSFARFAQQMAAPLAAQMERKQRTDGPQIKLCSLCGHRRPRPDPQKMRERKEIPPCSLGGLQCEKEAAPAADDDDFGAAKTMKGS